MEECLLNHLLNPALIRPSHMQQRQKASRKTAWEIGYSAAKKQANPNPHRQIQRQRSRAHCADRQVQATTSAASI